MELDSTLNKEAQSYATEPAGRAYYGGSSSKITKGKGVAVKRERPEGP